jgi:hypothetical protein
VRSAQLPEDEQNLLIFVCDCSAELVRRRIEIGGSVQEFILS